MVFDDPALEQHPRDARPRSLIAGPRLTSARAFVESTPSRAFAGCSESAELTVVPNEEKL
jgi:hypothetical protein